MELVLEYKGLSLIKKYDKYYIRFIGGQREEYPCDLAISNKEAMFIISSNETIKNVRDEYKKKVKWTSRYFIDSFLVDYMFYECNKCKRKINEAYDNRVNTRENTYVGESENGLRITMYLDSNDKTISVFPIYEGDD